MTSSLLLGAVGLVLLLSGGELLVRGASTLARRTGVSPLAIGLTVVAFGTSAPELAVSLGASFAGQPDLAVGNVVGSNVFNVLFILGTSALIAPLVVRREIVRREAPLVIVVSLLLVLLALDGSVGRWEGALLTAGLAAFLWSSFRSGSVEAPAAEGSEPPGHGPLVAGLLVVGGLGLLVLGSNWLVDGATTVARALGVDELIIGLTLVAAGTSLPEVATSILAAARGERDIAVGNVLGSNVFNVLGIVGITALAGPEALRVDPAVLRFDLPVMVAAAVACLPVFATGHVIARWEGALLFGYYVAYVAYLFLAATEHAALGPYSEAMLLFVIPLTAVALVTVAVREWRASRDRDKWSTTG